MKRVAALVAFLFLVPLVAIAELPIPPLQSRVTDTTGTINAVERQQLEAELEQLERTKGAQIAVLVVPTTEGEAIESYALRVAEAWQIGRGKTDDGIVFVVAKYDRRMRIEVGYGLEGAVSDAVANRILDEIVAPEFRSGNFSGGITKGVAALSAIVRGEALPAPPPWQSRTSTRSSDSGFGDIFFLIVLLVMGFGRTFRTMFGPGLGALLTAGGVGFIGSLFMPVWLAIFFAIVAAAFVLIARDGPALRPYGRRTYRGYGGGWGGAGGFRGGGGRFGGGGASGSW